MAKRTLSIGPWSFSSKAKAKEYIRFILNKYAEGECISEEDDLFLRELILLHPEAAQKMGSGVESFSTRLDPVWKKTRHFVLIRSDGSSTDFSFLSCLDGADSKKDVVSALRQAVSDQIISFKAEAFSGDILPICPYLGVSVRFEEAHVDHAAPQTFRNLMKDWLALKGLSLEQVSISDPADNQWASEMTDSVQRNSWSQFHLQRASLRIISKTANLSHAKTNPQ